MTVVLGGAAECGNKRAVAAPAAARAASTAAMRMPSGIPSENVAGTGWAYAAPISHTTAAACDFFRFNP
jgi:hypothetical protein